MSEQLDWYGMGDRLARRRQLLTESVYRIGLCEVAHKLKEDPSTIKHQLDRDDKKRPSADLADLLEELDAEYRRAKAALLHERLLPEADLSPNDALRMIGVLAQSRFGVADKEAVQGVLARVRKDDP